MQESANASNRRRIRHTVSIDARVSGPSMPPTRCLIRDFSRAGMFLTIEELGAEVILEELEIGSDVEIVFSPRIGGLTRRAEVTGRVVRKQGNGFGAQLVGVDDDVFELMRALAANAISDRQQRVPAATVRAPEQIGSETILREGRAIVARHMRALAPVFVRDTIAHLFKTAAAASHPAEQRRADMALRDIEANAEKIALLIERRVVHGYATLGGLDSTLELSPLAAPAQVGGAPTLAESGDLGEMLAIELITERVEAELRAPCFEIEQRLSQLLARPIDRENNPLASYRICRTFCDTVFEYGSGPPVRAAMAAALTRTFIAALRSLYEDLNAALKRYGVGAAFKEHVRMHNKESDEL